jgi:hypothetical protein
MGLVVIALFCLFALSLWAFGSASLTDALIGVAAVLIFGIPGLWLGLQIGLKIYGPKE